MGTDGATPTATPYACRGLTVTGDFKGESVQAGVVVVSVDPIVSPLKR